MYSELPLWLRAALVLALVLAVALAAAGALTGEEDEEPPLDRADAVAAVRDSFLNRERVQDLTCVEYDQGGFRCTFRFEGRRCSAVVSPSDGYRLDRCRRPRSRDVPRPLR